MSLENRSIGILATIHKYRKYVKDDLLPELLYCDLNDGTHLPLMSESPDGEHVFLYCLTCGWRKEAGWVTADHLNTYMRWRDLNPDLPLLTQ